MKKLLSLLLVLGLAQAANAMQKENSSLVPRDLREKWAKNDLPGIQTGDFKLQKEPASVEKILGTEERMYPTAGPELLPTAFEVEGEEWEIEHLQRAFGWVARFFTRS